jgi:hypothetical protein
MTGNRTSNTLCGMILVLTSSSIVKADELTLSGDARMTGSLREISDSGVIKLTSPLSPDPIELKAGAAEKVTFSGSQTTESPAQALIELFNGDLLPVTIEALQENQMVVSTEDAGRLLIPRAVLKSLQFGLRKPSLVYSGPENQEAWSSGDEGRKGWGFAGNALVANGEARASKTFDLPEQFTLKFTLKWQANPSFQIYFADPLTPQVERIDRYYLQFNAAGLEVKRESSNGKRFQTVILLPRTPDEYPTSQLDVELRVDRKTSRIQLFLNGDLDAVGVDPSGDPPTGRGVMLVNASPPGSTQEISRIEIHHLDNSRARHRTEERGNPHTDSLISREDDRWSGRLLSIRKTAEGAVFLFKSDFQEAPLELAEEDISTIFFAAAGSLNPAPPAIENTYLLRLRGEGSLRVSSCVFSEKEVTAQHPLLGPLRFNRNGVTSLERIKNQNGAKPTLNP